MLTKTYKHPLYSHVFRKGLHRVGEKLFLLGLIELIRPVVLLYPVWLLLSEAVLITKQIQTTDKLEAKSVMQVIKALLILGVTLLQIRVVSLLPGIGYSCLALGTGCFALCQSDALLKPATPLLAHNLYKIDQGIDLFTTVQKTFMQQVSLFVEPTSASTTAGASTSSGASTTSAPPSSSPSPSHPPPHRAVEEVDDDEEEETMDIEDDRDCEDNNGDSSSAPLYTPTSTTGLRKRK